MTGSMTSFFTAQKLTTCNTGLRNQYGFFEDISRFIQNHINIRIGIVGISRFSEINELYGYRFGNLVLQQFGRYLLDHVKNRGSIYRLDGSRFAVTTQTLSIEDLEQRYNDFRIHFRKGLEIEGTFLPIELNAGLFRRIRSSSLSYFK